MANSAAVNAGDVFTPERYNNLRADVLDGTTGHGHTGGQDGKPVSVTLYDLAPAPSAVGDTGAVGTAAPSRGDHRHAREALTTATPAASAVGNTSSDGVATDAAHDDHRHAREAFGSAPADLALANADGSAATLPHSDHAHRLALLTTAAAALASEGLFADTGADLLTLSLAAGRWLVVGEATLQGIGGLNDNRVLVRLWDGTTTFASVGAQLTAVGQWFHVGLSAVATLASAADVRLMFGGSGQLTVGVEPTAADGTAKATTLSAVRLP